MKRFFALVLIVGSAGLMCWGGEPKSFTFRDTTYIHRWSKANQHEFTPEEQDDLDKFEDMITVNGYPAVKDGDGLAAAANAVLENYKNAKAKILKADSVPRTSQHEAEHFIAAVFGRPEFIEVAFARFRMVNGKGYSFVYSHRIYGKKSGDPMSAWLGEHGADVEKALMESTSMPTPALAHQG
jgi:hypothetical protein